MKFCHCVRKQNYGHVMFANMIFSIQYVDGCWNLEHHYNILEHCYPFMGSSLAWVWAWPTLNTCATEDPVKEGRSPVTPKLSLQTIGPHPLQACWLSGFKVSIPSLLCFHIFWSCQFVNTSNLVRKLKMNLRCAWGLPQAHLNTSI